MVHNLEASLTMRIFLLFSEREEVCYRSAHHRDPAVYQAGDPDHDRVPRARFRGRPRHPRAHHLRLRRPRDDGDGQQTDTNSWTSW